MFFFFNDTATTEIYTLSLPDALPISAKVVPGTCHGGPGRADRQPDPPTLSHIRATSRHPLQEPRSSKTRRNRSEEHTSELQSPCNLVCRLLLEKKKNTTNSISCVSGS